MKFELLRRLALACWLLVSTLAMAADEGLPAEPIPAAALQADVDVLQKAYEALHPGLYRYNTPEQTRAHFDTLRRALAKPRDLRQAYLAFSEFAATVRCGHTYANFYNQPEAIQHALFEGHDRVPFEFRWIEGRMVVTRDLTARGQLPRGTEVSTIDGIATTKILEKLMRVARADGGNEAKRVALLEVQGEDRYETFDVFLPLYFPRIGAHQRLGIITPDGKTRTVEVDALTDAQRQAARREQPQADDGGWTFTLDHGIARLRMPSWALYESQWDWHAFIDKAFARMADEKPRALVIDLRGNEGGIDVGDAIVPHLIDAPLTVFNPPRLVRYRKIPDDLSPYLTTWDRSFKDWGEDAQPRDERFYTLKDDDAPSGEKILKPAAPRFTGRVFVLVGATNSSATFQFAEQVQRARVATLVGQPTGGNRRGINGGAFFFVRLPNSHIELDLPLIARFPAGDPPDAGLLPDIAVSRMRADIIAGVDAEMAAVERALAEPR